MKALQKMKSVYNEAMLTCSLIMASAMTAPAAVAIDRTDLTEDMAGGSNFGTMATNVDNSAQEAATLIISLVSIGGFVVVALSIYQLWKASKDEREKPMSAIVGLFIGGMMAGVGTVMWIMRNTVVGAAA